MEITEAINMRMNVRQNANPRDVPAFSPQAAKNLSNAPDAVYIAEPTKPIMLVTIRLGGRIAFSITVPSG